MKLTAPLLPLVLLALLIATPWALAQPEPGPVKLWDTVTPLQAPADLASRDAWRAVTASDSGRLQGDLVVETRHLTVGFGSRLGQVLASGKAVSGQRPVAVRPVGLTDTATVTTTMAQLGDVVIVQADFSTPKARHLPITFTFRGDGSVALRREGATSGLRLSAPLDLALVPSTVGDDLIYDPRNYPSAKALTLPSEHVLLGLVRGEGRMLVMTWQEAMPTVRLELYGEGERRHIAAIEFVGGTGVSLVVLDAPGIWHREKLGPQFLERDVALQWKPPFPAVWLTQLYEDELKTTFTFQDEKQEHWRGGIGSYTLPAWFSDGTAMFSLGKQIQPRGEAIIYFLERRDDTPEGVDAPMDVVHRTLSADVRAGVLDVEGRPTWWPTRPDCAIGGETCDVMIALQKVFAAGEEVKQQLFVRGGAEDMCFHLQVMFERNGRYYPFAQNMISYLDAQAKTNPKLTPYLHELRAIAKEMLVTYDRTRDTLGSMKYARTLEQQTIALAKQHRPDNVPRLENLRQGWCGMGGAHEELSRRENTFARKLYQQAAYRAATNPAALKVAEEVRRCTKQCLMRPDSYEMWEYN